MDIRNRIVSEDRIGIPQHIESRRKHVREVYASVAEVRERWIIKNSYYYEKLSSFLRFIIEPEKKVILFRCELGQILDVVSPSRAVGVDICQKMVSLAQRSYPQYRFICSDPESIKLRETYEYIIFYTLGDIIDIEMAFLNAGNLADIDSRLIVINYNYQWRPLVVIAERLGWKVPQPTQNWLNIGAIENLLHLTGYEAIKKYYQILLPIDVPLLSWILNNFIAKLPIIKRLCFVQVVVARKIPRHKPHVGYSVSVIIPCKNEKGNIEQAVRRIPHMGKGTEIIFCDDKSMDGTKEEIERIMKIYPEKDIKLVKGPGICKSKNVWCGFDAASGDILMILDADLTVIPEELPYFYHAIAEGYGEFINGSRMIYPMEGEAMRWLNIIGNRFFGLFFSYILGQRITDTLCGTKVFWRKDWPRIKPLIGTWRIEDRWGDYELLFGAAKLHLKIIEVPVHYVERIYGETKMKRRLLNGWVMLRMSIAAFRRFKFI